MTNNSTASLASAVIAAVLVLATWSSTLSMPSARAAEATATVSAPAAAHVILA